jgi:DNA invertase Pin-like site-specific DNA recombinase
MPDERPLMIGLVRVSTGKQAQSGLGGDAQHAEIEAYCGRIKGELIYTYEEVESGKHNHIKSRPRLMEAARHAVEVDGILVIAKIDRLIRSVSVLQFLRDMKVKFVACDNPHATKMTVTILAAVAENEAEQISIRTKQALEAYRAGKKVSRRIRALYPDGVPPAIAAATAGKLGASLPQCRNLTDAGKALGRTRSIEVRRQKARDAAEAIGRLVERWRAKEPGLGLAELGRRLDEARRKPPRGGDGKWTGKQVARVLARLKPPA